MKPKHEIGNFIRWVPDSGQKNEYYGETFVIIGISRGNGYNADAVVYESKNKNDETMMVAEDDIERIEMSKKDILIFFRQAARQKVENSKYRVNDVVEHIPLMSAKLTNDDPYEYNGRLFRVDSVSSDPEKEIRLSELFIKDGKLMDSDNYIVTYPCFLKLKKRGVAILPESL